MGFELRGFQATLCEPVTVDGIGVHSGEPVSLTLTPASPDTGIIFRVHIANGATVDIPARVPSVVCTAFCTAIGRDAISVHTIEHLMAALYATGIDNLIVEIRGGEVPVLDGSSDQFLAAFDLAGIEHQAVKRRYIRVLKPVRIENGASWAEFKPHEGTRFEVEIDFESPAIGRQAFAAELTAETFRNELASARTFGFLKDVEGLWAAGKALGSSLENSVVIGKDERVINPEGLRWTDEFVRHKTLDAVGDLALAGAPFLGCFRSYRGGHALNAAVLRTLLKDRSAYEIVEAPERRSSARGAELVAVSSAVYAPWVL